MSQAHQKLTFRIHGMDCAEEVALLKRELAPVVGGEEQLAFDILNAKLAIQVDDSKTSVDAIIQAVKRTGMRAEIWQEKQDANEGFLQQYGRTVLTTVSGLCGALGFFYHAWSAGGFANALGSEGLGIAAGVPKLAMAFYVIGIIAGVWPVLPKAWRALIGLRPDMNLLMLVAILGAVAIGEWFEAATVAFLFSVSLLLEAWSMGRARKAIHALMDLSPPFARVREDSCCEKEVLPEKVDVGTVFYVRPGEKIPLDGLVVSGESDVNQAPITGESVPMPKRQSDEVFAGTINGDGALEVKCTKTAGDSTLAHIIRMVGEAQSRRAPSEKWVEKFARVYTPVVMATAAALFLLPPVFFGGEWYDWLYRALVLLVIACPCALVISTPVSVVAALASAARNGVLVKGGAYIEAPAHLTAIALDKTGTLTEGKPIVVEIVPLNGHDEAELLERAAALEMQSNHPIASAILHEAKQRGIKIPIAEHYEIIQGKGATGIVRGKQFWLGSHRLLEERKQETPDVTKQLGAMQQAGRTVVVIGNDHHVCGFIALQDTIRPSAVETIDKLRAAGIKHIAMLTGDNQGTANAIAKEAGITEVHAELLPADKVQVMESLVKKHGQVAMVGDGVNDAPALARATLGIAMGAAGSDAALETADIALMSDDLTKLPWLIQHARRTLSVIRQNIIFALAVKVLFVVLTFSGNASLWSAIAADMGTSLLVIFNGLRLLKTK